MSITVLVEPLPDGSGFRARTGEPLNLTATAATRHDAIARINELFAERVRAGAAVCALPVSGPDVGRVLANAGQAGRLSEGDWKAWREDVEEYRRECDEADRRRLGVTEPYVPE